MNNWNSNSKTTKFRCSAPDLFLSVNVEGETLLGFFVNLFQLKTYHCIDFSTVINVLNFYNTMTYHLVEKYDGCFYSLCQKIQTLKILPKMQGVVMVSVTVFLIYTYFWTTDLCTIFTFVSVHMLKWIFATNLPTWASGVSVVTQDFTNKEVRVTKSHYEALYALQKKTNGISS